MPQIIIAAAAYALEWISWKMLALVIISSAYSYDRSRSARRKARAAYNDSLDDRLIQVATVDAARARVYGRVRVADGIVFKGTHGSKSEHFTLVMALAGHELDGLEGVYFNDQLLSLDGSGYVATAPWSRNLRAASVATMAPGSSFVVLPAGTHLDSIQVILPGSVGERTVDQLIPFDAEPEGGGGVLVSTSALYNGSSRRVTYQLGSSDSKARVRFFSGAPGQDLGAVLAGNFPGLITSGQHRFAGIACLVVDLEYDQDAFPTGVPAISAVVRGAKVLDPRDGITRWTDNPALCARDWALYAHGGGLSADDLDDASVIAAANACDVTASFTTVNGSGGGSSTQVLRTYTCGLVARTDQAPDQVLGQLINAMAGRWGWAGGLLRVRAGAYTAPTVEITEDWISDQGDIEIVSTLPRTELVNVITPTIANAAQDYVATPIPRIAPSEYIAQDGAEYPLDLQLDAVTDTAHAAHVAGVVLREGRQALTVSLTCNNRALVLELFDPVSLTLPRFGWAAKAFEVLGWQFTLQGGIRLTLRETAASIYTVGASFSRDDAAPNTALPSPYSVPALSIATLASGSAQLLRQADGTLVSRIRVTWAAIQNEAVLQGGAVELRYGRVSQAVSEWQTLSVPGTEVGAWIDGVQDGAAYAVAIRARNKLVAGAWSTQLVHVVQGKTAAPASVADFAGAQAGFDLAFSWSACPDVDYAETELRHLAEADFGALVPWDHGVTVWRGAATQASWRPPADGTYRILAQHQDTSGNWSGAPAQLDLVYVPGDATQTPVLDFSRPVILLLADNAGAVSSYASATSAVRVLAGGVDVTADWTLSRTNGSGVTSTLAAGVVSVTDLSVDEGLVTVTATRSGFADLSRALPLVKVKAGPTGPGGGNYTDFRFTRSASAPSTPTGNTPAGWFDAPPAGFDPLYMVRGVKNSSGDLQGGWSTPVRLDGTPGASGDSAQVEYSADGATAWHATFTGGDLYMRVRVGAGAWSAAIRIVGEDGLSATAYWLTRSAGVLQRSAAGVYTPASLVLGAYSQSGAAAPAAYAGRFVVDTTDDGSTWTPRYTSATDETGTTYTPPANIKAARVRLYLAGGTSTLLDEDLVPVVLDGSTAKSLQLTATSQVFRLDKAGTASPASITFSASGSNLAGSPSFSVIAGTASLTGTGSTRALAYASLGSDTATIQVSWDGLTDTLTVAKLREGVDAVSVLLGNENHTLPAAADGTVTSFAGCGTTIQAFDGATALTYHPTTLAPGRFTVGARTVSPSGSGIILGSISGSGSTVATVADHGGINTEVDTLTISYPVTARKADGSDVVITVVQTLSKARAGTDGAEGPRGSVEASRAISGSVWSNTEAAAALTAAGYGAPVRLDRVTLYNAGASYVETRYWDGAAWVAFSTLINGNLLVLGSIGADKLVANMLSTDNVLTRGLTVRDSNGAIILSSGQPLSGNQVVALSGWLNSNVAINANGTLSGAGSGQVTIGGLGYTGALDATKNNQPYRSSVAPASPVTGDIWVDISVNPNVVRVWAAGAWRLSSTVGASLVVGAEGQISGQISSANVSTWIAAAAIGSAQIASASIGLAKIDLATITNLAALNAYTGQLTVDATGHIKGGATNYSTGTGFWIGNDAGTYKFRIGSTTQYMRWTGAALELKLDTMTASIAGGSISHTTSSTGTFNLGSRTASVSGGVAPYTYSWSLTATGPDEDGATVYISSGAESATAVFGSLLPVPGAAAATQARCVVTDANGRSAAAVIFVASANNA